jgi:hypothetical protein
MTSDSKAPMESTLNMQLEWVRGVDGKIQFLLTIEIAMLGALAAVVPDPDTFAWAWHGLWVIAGSLGLLGSLVCCGVATIPRTKAPAPSLIFFGEIAKLTVEEFGTAILKRTDDVLLNDLITQTHKNAQLAASKYAVLRVAYAAFFVGLAGWLPAMYFLYRG